MNFIEKGRVASHEQKLFLGHNVSQEGSSGFSGWSGYPDGGVGLHEVPAIQSIDLNYDNQASPINYIGINHFHFAPRGPQIGNMSVAASFITRDDPFLQYTGEIGTNGIVMQDYTSTGTAYSFVSGYLTNYTSECSVGEIPKINASFSVYGNIGKIPTGETAQYYSHLTEITNIEERSSEFLRLVAPGSIELEMGEFDTDRIQSYNLSIDCPRNPIYAPGNRMPYSVTRNPTEVNLTVNFELNTYTGLESIKNFPFSGKNRDVVLRLKDFERANNVVTFNFDRMELKTESYNAALDDNVKIAWSFQGIYT